MARRGRAPPLLAVALGAASLAQSPLTTSFTGASLFTLSVALTLDNTLHLAMSNGLWGRIGF
jgi:hypothetical protein